MNDRELIQKIVSGQNDLFKLLVSKYKNKVISIICSFCGHNCEYEDIAQNVFIKVFGSLNKFRFESSFSTWVYKIAINESITFSKKRKSFAVSLNEKTGSDEEMEIIDLLPDSNDGTEEQLLKQETQGLIQKAMLSLQDNYRTIIILKDIEDLSYDEIASAMDISLDKVKVWLFRARQQLRAVITKGNLI
ncbi:sigma-70 family RNA polymerase sigma factor [Elusimicrobiota bacterium]